MNNENCLSRWRFVVSVGAAVWVLWCRVAWLLGVEVSSGAAVWVLWCRGPDMPLFCSFGCDAVLSPAGAWLSKMRLGAPESGEGNRGRCTSRIAAAPREKHTAATAAVCFSYRMLFVVQNILLPSLNALPTGSPSTR